MAGEIPMFTTLFAMEQELLLDLWLMEGVAEWDD
jgi:hypothetical protein